MVVRNAVSAKHSEVACALLERSRGTAYLLASHDSSSDSDTPSGGDCCEAGGGALECPAPPLPPICHPGPPQYVQPSAIPEASLTLQQVRDGIIIVPFIYRIKYYLRNHTSCSINVWDLILLLFISHRDFNWLVPTSRTMARLECTWNGLRERCSFHVSRFIFSELLWVYYYWTPLWPILIKDFRPNLLSAGEQISDIRTVALHILLLIVLLK